MKFTVKKRVYLRDTDATGVLYFNQLQRLALEAFEDFLISKQLPLREILEKKNFLMPIVRAESDFTAPLRIGDEVAIEVAIDKVGISSLSMQYAFYDAMRALPVGKALIVHVCVDRATFQKIPLPEELQLVAEGSFEKA